MVVDNLKALARSRLLDEMLGGIKESGGADWTVLIMDDITTRVMSSCCRMSDLLDYGVSLVETVNKRREPLQKLSGVYFISATEKSVRQIIEDFKTAPLYYSAHIFFSSKVAPSLLQEIKAAPGLLSKLRSLKEVNMEFLVVDKRTFLTDTEGALPALFGDMYSDAQDQFNSEIRLISERLATALVALKEFPTIRFRAGKPSATGATDHQSLVAQKIAVEVDSRLGDLQRSAQIPSSETSELIITDRGFDPVAPIIHEWTYEAMVYDLLPIKGNAYEYQAETEGGQSETKAHILDERDPVWTDLRHQHFADASIKISAMVEDFQKKNKAASYVRGRAGENGKAPLDMAAMRNLVKALPQYREQVASLTVHVEILSRLNRLLDEWALVEMGKLEQDLVYGNATSKEVVTFLGYHQALPPEAKMRLLMCYVATHPEKLDAAKQSQWQKLAGLTAEDMTTITNLEFIGVPVRKKSKATGLNFGRKRKKALRKDRPAGENEQTWELSRFNPMLQEILEDLVSNNLSSDEYPYVRPPSAGTNGSGVVAKGTSVRNKSNLNWAKKGGPVGTTGIAEIAPKGKRVIVFVVGGITHSEIRVAHNLTKKLGRDVVIGGTSLDTPKDFLGNLLKMGSAPESPSKRSAFGFGDD